MDYSLTNVTEGIEALAYTRVVIRPAGKLANDAIISEIGVSDPFSHCIRCTLERVLPPPPSSTHPRQTSHAFS